MKKLVFGILLLIGVVMGFAQTQQKKGFYIKKFSAGAMASVSGDTPIDSFPERINPFTLGYNLLPDVCITTNKTYHNLFYGLNNTARMTNGYFLREDFGLYITLVKNFSTRGGYAGVGADIFNKKVENVAIVLFPEVGANIKGDSWGWIFTVGMKINVQVPIWAIKKK